MDTDFSQESLNPPLENDCVDNNVMQFCSSDADVLMDKCDSQEDTSQRMDIGEDSPVLDSSNVQWFSANSINFNNVVNSMPDSSLYDPIEPLQDDDVPITPQNMEMPQESYPESVNAGLALFSAMQDIFMESPDLAQPLAPSPRADPIQINSLDSGITISQVGNGELTVSSEMLSVSDCIVSSNTPSEQKPLGQSVTTTNQENFAYLQANNVDQYFPTIPSTGIQFSVPIPEKESGVFLDNETRTSLVEQSYGDQEQHLSSCTSLNKPLTTIFSHESLPENDTAQQILQEQSLIHSLTEDQSVACVPSNQLQSTGFKLHSPNGDFQQAIDSSDSKEPKQEIHYKLICSLASDATEVTQDDTPKSITSDSKELNQSFQAELSCSHLSNITGIIQNGAADSIDCQNQSIKSSPNNTLSESVSSNDRCVHVEQGEDVVQDAIIAGEAPPSESVICISLDANSEVEHPTSHTVLPDEEKETLQQTLDKPAESDSIQAINSEQEPKSSSDDTEVVSNDAEMKRKSMENAAIEKAKADADLLEKFKQTELEGFWLAVRRDPTDFTSWTNLLEYVEKEDRLDNLRQAFDTFLHRYPYCYGYWKKYADVEKRHSNREICLQIYERGVVAIPLSIDLWLSYVEAVSDFYKDEEDCNTKIREIYSRAIDIASMDFRSDRLWESFIQWELTTQTKDYVRHVTSLYDRLIYIPTQMYYQNWENFKRHMEDNSVEDLFTDVELESLKREIILEMGHADDTDVSELEFIRMKDKARGIREEIYNRTYEEITKRWHFEEKIRRPYFHVKPLENTQLSNWHEYLDFEESEFAALNYVDDPSKWAMQRARVQFLYERCLIACALYEEMWLRYARFAENILQDIETARNVWRRACTVHLSSKHSLRWHWACFEERQAGNKLEPGQDWRVHIAWQVLEEAMSDDSGFYYPHEEHKNNPLVHSRRLDMMRRLGASVNEIVSAYEDSLKHFNELEVYSSAISLLSSRLARFLSYHVKDVERAKKILEEAIQKDLRNERLFTQLLDLIFHSDPLNVEAFCDIIDLAVERSLLPVRSKVAFAKRRLQYLEEFDSDVDRIRTAQEDFERLMKARSHAEDPSSSAGIVDASGDGPEAKRPLLGAGPTSSQIPSSSATDSYNAQTNYQAHYSMVNPPPTHSAAPTYAATPISQAPATTGWDQYAAYYYSGTYGGSYSNTAPPINVPPPVPSIYPSI